ncbi:restriction endonuclease subunit S [Pseudoalteromonas sp. bablab_jr010]|uniref:restriction endonuclease subunit S n=1 Tax=Pseudoalteromonas sp. bablab_jr010 TaxID=2755063 RepID=UPI0018F6824E|nr:restriction endonuclease subunit S [Pseudoalteromonas sp. bablab_jr010]
MELSLDKTQWDRYQLGELLVKNEENDKENASKNFDRFLKVEHLDAETFRVKRWASQEAGDELPPTFYKIFRKGQILYPTRNPHLKRAVVAEFDGICGEKTLTLIPNEDLVTLEFIKYLFHSNYFYEHAISSIIGSTNPHVRWRDIAKLEVLIPPLKEQNRISNLLKLMEEHLSSTDYLHEKTKVLEKVLIKGFVDKVDENHSVKIKLKDLYQSKLKSVKPDSLGEEEVLHYSLPSLIESKKPEVVKANSIKSNKILINEDVILFSKLNPIPPKVWSVKGDSQIKLGSTEWLPLRPTNELTKSYLEAYLTSPQFNNKVGKLIQGTSNSHKRVEPSLFYNMTIPVPDSNQIAEISLQSNKLINSKNKLDSEIKASEKLFKFLINQVF